MKKYLMQIGLLGMVGSLLTSRNAWAQETSLPPASSVAYSYEFEDDPLAATGDVAAGLRIEVRPVGMRSVLIRPRTQFISELLKSAENL